jgi:hypothetical protein
MGEAKRRKNTGNNEPNNPNWKKKKKMTRKQIEQMSQEILSDMIFTYRDGISKM